MLHFLEGHIISFGSLSRIGIAIQASRFKQIKHKQTLLALTHRSSCRIKPSGDWESPFECEGL